jgi:DNA-binding CsgD family transcriptional regulator
LDEAMSLVNEFRDDRLRGRVVLVQVYLDIQTGDYDTARQRLEGIIHLAHKRHDHLFSLILAVLAVVLLEQDMAEWSAKVLGMADKNKGIGQSRPEWTILERFPFMQGFQAKLRAYLGEEDFKQYHMAGKQLSVDDVLAIPRPTTQSKTSPDSLTPRELEVLHLLTEELSNPQIAEQLVVSRRTVDAHLRSIYAKLGVKSRDAALRVGRENRLI